MMEATLEQARLDKFVSNLRTKPGAQRGDAFISFTSFEAAVRCAHHFNGRRWDSSGVPVMARLLPMLPMPMAPSQASSFELSAEAPEFVPGALPSLSSSVKPTTTTGARSDVSTEDGDSVSSSDEKEVAA
jgi:hypothetical protein